MPDKTENPIVPVVGMGATYYCGTDRYPLTVIEIKSPREIVLQDDSYTRTDHNGFSECQTYDIQPNPNGTKTTVTLRKDGRWVQKGWPLNSFGYGLGVRRAYSDPSF